MLTGDEELVTGLQAGDRSVVKDPAEQAMLDYVEKLTRAPWEVQQTDVDALRGVGFSDVDVLDLAQVTAYFAFVNRLADGLGVELENRGA